MCIIYTKVYTESVNVLGVHTAQDPLGGKKPQKVVCACRFVSGVGRSGRLRVEMGLGARTRARLQKRS